MVCPYVDGFLKAHGKAMSLPAYYVEVFPADNNSWSSASSAPTSCSKASIMNRLGVQPWDAQLVLQWPTYTWSSSKRRHSEHHRILPRIWKGLWTMHLSYNTQSSRRTVYSTSSIDSAIKFTMEDTRPDGSIPFLDTLVIWEYNWALSTRVYRKPIHTDQYLQLDSYHQIGAKYSVMNTLNLKA